MRGGEFPYLELEEEGLSPGHDECDEQDDEDGDVLKVSIFLIVQRPALEGVRGQGSQRGHKGQGSWRGDKGQHERVE